MTELPPLLVELVGHDAAAALVDAWCRDSSDAAVRDACERAVERVLRAVTEEEFREGVLELLDELARRDAARLAAGVLEYVWRGLAEEGIELSADDDGSSLEPF